MDDRPGMCRLAVAETEELAAWGRSKTGAPPEDEPIPFFEQAQQIVRRLGAHLRQDHLVEFGFWVPEAVRTENPCERMWLEIFTPMTPVDFRLPHQEIRFKRELIEPSVIGEFAWAVVDGVQAGTREQVGAFYQLLCEFSDGSKRAVPDYLADSVPFGAFGPAELYDTSAMQAARRDVAHFQREVGAKNAEQPPRLDGPSNILQIHVGYATREGTIEALTNVYREIARKLQAAETLESWEENYVHFDAVQLMPVEPVIEYETGPGFWRPKGEGSDAEELWVELVRPDMTNWGYDILTSASPAVNPVLLGSGRPDELIDLIAELHGFPTGPIKVIFDVVFGHGDNQAVKLIAAELFAAQGMYGQVLDYRQPVVRAMLLEMQRRKVNFGADGVRVDGAQDFKYWDPVRREVFYDDDYLAMMNNLVQEVGGVTYRPWMIFEDGRPWPQADWELSSSYREVTKNLPNVYQWGPITFAHNTPFLFTFWISKWWRVKEITEHGGRWITGSANHDTLRRGTQVDPEERVNTYLGETLPEVFRRAYDNPAALLFTYVATPGVPMEFLNAIMRSPWSFIRNCDDRYAVKVASEENRFLYWALDEQVFDEPDVFRRLKSLGFADLEELRRFMDNLANAVATTRDNVPIVAAMINAIDPPFPGRPYDVRGLKRVARAWMDDVHDLCNVTRYHEHLDPAQVDFAAAVRDFRRKRSWLGDSFYVAGSTPTAIGDSLEVIEPTAGSVIFYGTRANSESGETLFFMMNMEGAPKTVIPNDLLNRLVGRADHTGTLAKPAQEWEAVLRTPGIASEGAGGARKFTEPITLHDSEGVVFASSRSRVSG